MALETVEERSSGSCGNFIVDHLFYGQHNRVSGGNRESMRWGNEEEQVEGIKAGKKGEVQGPGLVSREGVNPSACPYQRFRFSFIEINPKNERTTESAETNAGFNQSSQTVLGASSAR